MYNIRELTPEVMKCVIGGCPAIYEVTPEDMRCAIGTCPASYVSGEDYLIIGEKVAARDYGLEGKVGEDEVLIRVPRELIDGMEKLEVED